MKQLSHDVQLEVLLSEIETYRSQGEDMGIELFRDFRRETLRKRLTLVAVGIGAWMLYCGVVWYGVLRSIGAL